MIQCENCEFYKETPDGQKHFTCNPFSSIKEPECLMKLQLMRLDMILATYTKMLKTYEKLAPMQDKLLKYMKKEIDEINEAENWKTDENEEDHF